MAQSAIWWLAFNTRGLKSRSGWLKKLYLRWLDILNTQILHLPPTTAVRVASAMPSDLAATWRLTTAWSRDCTASTLYEFRFPGMTLMGLSCSNTRELSSLIEIPQPVSHSSLLCIVNLLYSSIGYRKPEDFSIWTMMWYSLTRVALSVNVSFWSSSDASSEGSSPILSYLDDLEQISLGNGKQCATHSHIQFEMG